mgnify:CR=1 FL=1
MSHQPFETWLLDDPEALSQAERKALQEHLETCQQCQRLDQKWQAARQELTMHRMVGPAPGFPQRWRDSLPARRAREQRKQAWRVFGLLLGVALLSLLALTGYLIATTTPADWLEALVGVISSSNALIQYSTYLVQSWLSSTPVIVSLVLWICLTLTLCFLILMWFIILWRTRIKGVLNS